MTSNHHETDQTTLIVGASRGIGLAWARHALETSKTRQVIALSRTAPDHPSLLALKNQFGDRLCLLAMEITDADSVAQAADQIDAKSIGCLINTTGVLHDKAQGIRPEKRFEDLSLDVLEEVMRVNAFGTALLLKFFLPKMVSDQRAIFAAISARVGSIEDNRIGGWYAYRASKAALNQLLKTASIEARRRYPNLIIASLHPGTTDTDLSKPFQANVAPEKLFRPEFVVEQLVAVLAGLSPEQSGGFFAWDGQAIPY